MARRPLSSPTGNPITIDPAHPNAGIEAAYRKKLLRLVDEMNRSYLYWITAYYRANTPEMAQDASPARALLRAMKGLGRRWASRFDQAAPELAAYFATAASERSDASLKDILKRGGFTVNFKTTAPFNDVLQATIAENVGLIKSIAASHFTQIEGMVMRSVQTGRDIHALRKDLQETFGVTRRRAAFIAKDQNNKATAVITRVRQQEIGVTKAIWLHSAGGRTPRPAHVKMSGKTYDVATRAFLEGVWTWPGVEINCRCVSKSIVPGYDP